MSWQNNQINDNNNNYIGKPVYSTEFGSYGREIGRVNTFGTVSSTQLGSYGKKIGNVDSYGVVSSIGVGSYGKQIGEVRK